MNVMQEKFGSIQLVCVDNTRNATGYAPTLRMMGDVLGVPDRAEKLITYYEGVWGEVRKKVDALPVEKRVRVYYAEGTNGLATDPSGPFIPI
jgi:iron complex transport system substrate-binding protein